MTFRKVIKVRFESEDVTWLTEACKRQIEGCQRKAFDGTTLFTPDGTGHYGALWTRDFYYVTTVFDLLDPREVRAALEYLLRGQRADGVMPDRRQADGTSVYCAGSQEQPVGLPPLDNSAFSVLLVWEYVRHTGEAAFFGKHRDGLLRAQAAIPRGEKGLVFNDPVRPHSPYGFADTVGQTGELLYCSLLDWQAWTALAAMLDLLGDRSQGARCRARADLIVRGIQTLWDEASGMFLAASHDCRQIDIWGSAFAVAVDFPLPLARRGKITAYLARNIDSISQAGQIRHLPAGAYWQRLLAPIAPDHYQNGGYWGTATGWAMLALAQEYPEITRRLFHTMVADYRRSGIYEWICGDRRTLPRYVASAVNPLAAARQLQSQFGFPHEDS